MKKNKRKYSYTLLLAASLFVLAGMTKTGTLDDMGKDGSYVHGIFASAGSSVSGLRSREREEIPTEKREEGSAIEEQMEEEQMEEERIDEVRQEVPIPVPVMYSADTAYFDDALFIGDSRTVGLYEYGNLGQAEVIADSGMSVYKIFQQEFKFSTGEKGTLEELLSMRKFGKVYIMLGINELGYQYEATVTRYEDMVERILELQPDTILFLEANLHITKGKSAASLIYNNENINRFNQAVAKMADDDTRFYLDVNELFDDEEGNLDETYTADAAHVLGKYYSDWVDWILDHAVKYSDA